MPHIFTIFANFVIHEKNGYYTVFIFKVDTLLPVIKYENQVAFKEGGWSTKYTSDPQNFVNDIFKS